MIMKLKCQDTVSKGDIYKNGQDNQSNQIDKARQEGQKRVEQKVNGDRREIVKSKRLGWMKKNCEDMSRTSAKSSVWSER